MRSIVAPKLAPTWSSALHATGQLTINLVPASEFTDGGHEAGTHAIWNLGTGTLWLNTEALGDDEAIDGYIHQMLHGVAAKHRPKLSVVGKPAHINPAELTSTVAQTEQPSTRPALRLVRPAVAAPCLEGCEYRADRVSDDASGGHTCSVTTGVVGTSRSDESAAVSVDRFQDGDEGTRAAVVSLGSTVNGRTQDPQEMTPAAARALAARLLEAADLAEQVNQEDRSRRTA